MSKQDRQGARTVTDLERKYNLGSFGEQFAKVAEVATDARAATIELDEKLQSEIAAVRGELALKVGTNDSGEIISMIEGYADEIRFQSNVLVIDSDFFTLSRNGVVTMTSSLIELAKITDAEILRASIIDADITLGTITDADIELGTITDAKISYGSIYEAEIEECNIGKCRISESYIGGVYFDKYTSRTDYQMMFTDEGMFLYEQGYTADSRNCLVWKNNDGFNTLRIRALDSKLYIEGLGVDSEWSHNSQNADLIVFGMSIREMYDKIQELSDHTHDYTVISNTATCTDSGVVTYGCSCGKTYSESIGALGHNYQGGYCTLCGEADPGSGGEGGCIHANTSEGGNSIDSCHTEMWVQCNDCGELLSTWTESHHGDINDHGYCNACGAYVG